MLSKAELAELARGKHLAEQMIPLRSYAEVGRMLGISPQAVRKLERKALSKVSQSLMSHALTLAS